MNGIIIVDKPAGFTSHDVVAKLRGIYKTRRIGHTGTLDPMATGVLPIFIGRATRACTFAESDTKTYRAELQLGVETDTQDSSGTILRETPVTATLSDVLRVSRSFVGEIEQIPPMYSAVKIDGVRLYKLARQGVEVARPPRPVTIFSIGVTELSRARYILDVHCGKGTYIRTLCADIGTALGCGAMLTALRRTRAGAFSIDDAHTLDEIQAAPLSLLRPLDSLFAEHPAVTIDDSGIQKCKNGAPVPFSVAPGTYRVYAPSGEFLMLAESSGTALLTIKSFFEVDKP